MSTFLSVFACRTLRLNGLELTEIVDGAFTDVSLSQDLNLQNNNIRTLQENAFDNLDARDVYVIAILSTNLSAIFAVIVLLRIFFLIKIVLYPKFTNRPSGV